MMHTLLGKLLAVTGALACAFAGAPAAALTLTFAVHVTGSSAGAPLIDDFEMTWTFDPVLFDVPPNQYYDGDVAGVVDTPQTGDMLALAGLVPPYENPTTYRESYAAITNGSSVQLIQLFRQGDFDTLQAGEYKNQLLGGGAPAPTSYTPGAFVYYLQAVGELSWIQTATRSSFTLDIPATPPTILASRTYTGTARLVGWDVEPAGNPAVPEPATWALMIVGFGLTGTALRRRRQPSAATW
ncbi:PEPxxWA-CTERM sorting domain-containing protein [Phenylobacterium sp.]|uniref:PEPxxWA-CTERM sorting domain-containing protein n=1 Tax=Phenylobacterium sp. TaxID=1871053 RepID=UPI0026013611|nr:PEPxxWA-CTERM sorting domain-containing protein [Phenylobacterium sp.]